MSTPDQVAAAAVKAWLEAIPLSVTPSVISTELPEAGDKWELPTLSAVWPDQSWQIEQRRCIGMVGDRAVWDYGSISSQVEIVWRSGSRDDAELARSEIRSHLLLTASDDGAVPETLAVRLEPTFVGSVVLPVHIRLTPGSHVMGPDQSDTVRRSFWEVRLVGEIEYPLLVLESEPGTGTMDIILEQSPGASPSFGPSAFEMNDYL